MIVGLHGPAGSGKDTHAAMLMLKRSALHMKFADPLYDMAHAIDPVFSTGMSREDKQAPLLGIPDYGSRRNFLQLLGTEFMRNYVSPDFWIEHMARRVSKVPAEQLIVVSDVRFPNEAELIRNAGGLIVHLYPNWPCETFEHSSAYELPVGIFDSKLPVVHGMLDLSYKHLLALVDAHVVESL